MTNIGIIICGRYGSCAGGKCLRSMRERVGGFAAYPREEELALVGYASCGGCPGGNIEYVPGEMVKNGVSVIHFATGMVVGYPPCPFIKQFRDFIESAFHIPVLVGTHPIPLKYHTTHNTLPFWNDMGMASLAGSLFAEDRQTMALYD